jgi:hypothetical protein
MTKTKEDRCERVTDADDEGDQKAWLESLDTRLDSEPGEKDSGDTKDTEE